MVPYQIAAKSGIENSLKTTETITLPKKNWKAPHRVSAWRGTGGQKTMLDVLMTIIYFNIRDPNGPKFQ